MRLRSKKDAGWVESARLVDELFDSVASVVSKVLQCFKVH